LGGWDFFIDPTTVFVALGFSALVGVVFGVWPARTAAKLQPVDALRFE
jgi:putative ABC transport system permease protein